MSERRRLRAAALFLFLSILALAFGGCTVTTNVSLSEQSPGRGTVAVSVALDRAALSAVGGLGALKSEMSTQDLVADGWSVSGPTAATAGGAVVTVQHGYSSDAEAGQLLSDVAGDRVFGLSISSHRSFWHTSYRLTGKVDLTCGLDCFGDSGLRAATGSPVGVQPGPLSSAAGGESPSSALRFTVEARLPGGARVAGTSGGAGGSRGSGGSGGSAAGSGGSGGSASGGAVTWSPQLGRTETLDAASSTLNTGAVAAVVVAAAVVVLVVLAASWWVFVRRRRRRRSADDDRDDEEAVGASGVGSGSYRE